MELEKLIIEELGQFGKYQLQGILMIIVAAGFNAFSTAEYLFTAGRIPTRCVIPECEAASGPHEFSPPWLLSAIPGSDSAHFDNCRRFSSNSTPLRAASCPASLFNQLIQEPCEAYVYAANNTIVHTFDMACDEWRRSFVGSIRTVGLLFGLPLTGFFSDRWGRSKVLTVTALNTAWLGLVRVTTSSYAAFVLSGFFECLLGGGAYSSAYILMTEVVGPKYRVVAGAISSTSFATGHMLLALIAWGLPYWKHLTLAVYAPQLLTIGYLWLAPTSIRWFIGKGKTAKAQEAITNAGKRNGKQVSQKTLTAIKEAIEMQKQKNKETGDEPLLILQVFRNKPILLRCIVSPVWWITLTFVYYGLSINAVNMVGNPYLNYLAVSAVEIPGYWISVLLVDRIGRKPLLSVAFLLCSICQAGYIFIPTEMFGASLTVYLIGKLAISTVGTTVYVYTAELYPTKYRHSLFAFSSMMGRFGAILAPLTPALGATVWAPLPFVLFGALALAAALLVLLTPETRGLALPDTMAQAATMGAAEDTPGPHRENEAYSNQKDNPEGL